MDHIATSHQARSGEILHKIAAYRSTVYRWLALGFYPPDASLAAALHSGQVADELFEATRWLGTDQGLLVGVIQELHTVPSTHLEQEYQRLFILGVERISLSERTYIWQNAASLNRAYQTNTENLLHIYTSHGVRPSLELADHAAVELEFMAYLCSREAAAWENLQFSSARSLRRFESVFLDEHLGQWLPEVCWQLAGRASHSFYAALAAWTPIWLVLERGPEGQARR